MRDLKTTVIASVEAALMAISAEAFLKPEDWKAHTAIFGLAFLRALFGFWAADAKTATAATTPPSPPNVA